MTRIENIFASAWRKVGVAAVAGMLLLPALTAGDQALAGEGAGSPIEAQQRAVGGWAIDHVRSNTATPLKITNEDVRGGIELRQDGTFFLFVTYSVADSENPAIRALSGALPVQAVASGTYKISDGTFAYTPERVGGPPMQKGGTNYRKISFEGEEFMLLTAELSGGDSWSVVWKRLD